MAVQYPNPNILNPDRMLQVAEDYLTNGDLGAARFYGNFAMAVRVFDQQPVDSKSLLAPKMDTRQYLQHASQVVKCTISLMEDDLEERLEGTGIIRTAQNSKALFEEHSPHAIRYRELQNQFGTEYSFLL